MGFLSAANPHGALDATEVEVVVVSSSYEREARVKKLYVMMQMHAAKSLCEISIVVVLVVVRTTTSTSY